MLPQTLREQLAEQELTPQQQWQLKGGQRRLPVNRVPNVSPVSVWDEIIIRLEADNELSEVITAGGMGQVKFGHRNRP